MEVILGNICYPKSQALIIPGNTKGTMSRGRAAKIVKSGLTGISKEAKDFTSKNKIEVGQSFTTGPGRLNRRGLKKIYHAVVKRLQSDFTSIHMLKKSLRSAFRAAIADGMKSIVVCAIGIDHGGLDKRTVAMITYEICKAYDDSIKIKIIDSNEEFINEVNNFLKKGKRDGVSKKTSFST